MQMDMYAILDQKRRGGALDEAQIEYAVRGAATGAIPDYQLTALLMAVCIRGMNPEETRALTQAMTKTGSIVDFSDVPGMVADKHSSGGVGDTTTLIVAPVCAACGLKVAKMSGRSLGHTGGTIDKLEAIPGFSAALSPARFKEVLSACGLAVAQQTDDIAPADRRLYALRDATATVESVPLIASSIMSKKLALKTDVLVLDVKCGTGAFMKTREDAVALAKTMVDIGRAEGRAVRALVTAMDQPLGAAVGNALEVWEAVEVLSGRHVGTPLMRVCVELSAHMLQLGGVCAAIEAGRDMAKEAFSDGTALSRLREMVKLQGGDASVLSRAGAARLLTAKTRFSVPADKGGVVQCVDALKVGLAARTLGAGRLKKTDAVDPAVGVVCRVRAGDAVTAGQPLFEVHANQEARLDGAVALLLEACVIEEKDAENREDYVLEVI